MKNMNEFHKKYKVYCINNTLKILKLLYCIIFTYISFISSWDIRNSEVFAFYRMTLFLRFYDIALVSLSTYGGVQYIQLNNCLNG